MSELSRLEALQATQLLDSAAEERFERLARLAAYTLGTEVALISLVDENRQWFKAKHGIDALETPREQAFCHFAIQSPNEVMVVPNASQDARFVNNPLVTGDPNIQFYAGAPLVTKDGHALGTLCVVDSKARTDFDSTKQQILKDLAASVMTEIELANQSQVVSDLQIVNEELQHRMGNMYAHISALVSMLARTDVDKEQLVRRIREKITTLSQTQALLATRNYASVPMSELINSALSPFKTGLNAQRVNVQTHDDFEVSARGAFILTLMINELGTNAIKHGALQKIDGQVDVSWQNGDEIKFTWRETGMLTPLSAPASTDRKGFGTQILQKIVPLDLQGDALFDLTENGLLYSVSAKPDRIRLL